MSHRIQIRDLQDMLLTVDQHRPVEVCIESGIESDWCAFIDKVEYSCGRARIICIPDGELRTTKEEDLDERCDELIDAQERMLELLKRFDVIMEASGFHTELDDELSDLTVDVKAELDKEH